MAKSVQDPTVPDEGQPSLDDIFERITIACTLAGFDIVRKIRSVGCLYLDKYTYHHHSENRNNHRGCRYCGDAKHYKHLERVMRGIIKDQLENGVNSGAWQQSLRKTLDWGRVDDAVISVACETINAISWPSEGPDTAAVAVLAAGAAEGTQRKEASRMIVFDERHTACAVALAEHLGVNIGEEMVMMAAGSTDARDREVAAKWLRDNRPEVYKETLSGSEAD